MAALVSLQQFKAFVKVIGGSEDALLQMILDGAHSEALRFMNRKRFGVACPVYEADGTVTEPADDEAMPADVAVAIMLLAQSRYEATPGDHALYRRAAETLLMPLRCNIGVF
jgi:hypothetical protein